MVVVGILIADEPEVGDRFVVAAAVNRQRGGIEPLFYRLWRRLTRRRLALADVQVETHSLVQLLFFGVLPEHRLEHLGGRPIVASLQHFDPAFVKGHGFEVGGTALGCCGRRGGPWTPRWRRLDRRPTG